MSSGSSCVAVCNKGGYWSEGDIHHECYKENDSDSLPDGCIVNTNTALGNCICNSANGFSERTFDTEPKECLPSCLKDH